MKKFAWKAAIGELSTGDRLILSSVVMSKGYEQ